MILFCPDRISRPSHFVRCVGRAQAMVFLVLVLAMAPGCWTATGTPVEGTVMIEGGVPLDRGTIFFVNDKITCRGAIGSDGRYRITGGPGGHRVPAGRYKVFFENSGIPKENSMEMMPQIAARLETSEQTDLFAEVPESRGVATLDFTVAPAKPRP